MKYIYTLLLLLLPLGLFAQQQGPVDEKEQEKKMTEFIENEIERYENLLKLDDGQSFYVDSILFHNYNAMNDELKEMSKAKVGNSDFYYSVQDKWMDATYDAFQKLLTPEQWNRYLKSGAARDKKAREKRQAQAAEADATAAQKKKK